MFPRFPLSFAAFLLTLAAAPAQTTNTAPTVKMTPPVASAPVKVDNAKIPAPAFVDVVTFNVHLDGESRPLIVTSAPALLRVDEPKERYSLIYDAANETYTGLEHSNYTYWVFNWPQVQAAIENSKRYESHMRELNADGLIGYQQPVANSPADASASASGDGSGYVWRPTTEHKKIADIDCVRWTGDTLTGESVEVWCSQGPMPQVQAAMEKLRPINEPMALVPVRTLVPPIVYPIYDALVKGGVTPILIRWGGDIEKNEFVFVSAKQREGKIALFTVPKLYNKTTLVTMDGIGDQAPGGQPVAMPNPGMNHPSMSPSASPTPQQ